MYSIHASFPVDDTLDLDLMQEVDEIIDDAAGFRADRGLGGGVREHDWAVESLREAEEIKRRIEALELPGLKVVVKKRDY